MLAIVERQKRRNSAEKRATAFSVGGAQSDNFVGRRQTTPLDTK
jgi:hypothetical protein